MSFRNAIVAALLAAVGLTAFAGDAQAIGKRKKAASCNTCANAAPAPCTTCGGASVPVTVVGTTGTTGTVVMGETVPNPMPGAGAAAMVPATNGMVIPASYTVPATAPAKRGLFRR